MFKRAFELLVLLGLVSSTVRAADLDPSELARDEEVARRAKQRAYPGGPDESDLKVQVGTPAPVRRMAPQVETAVSESAEAND